MSWTPELPASPNASQRELQEWLNRQFRGISTYTGTIEDGEPQSDMAVMYGQTDSFTLNVLRSVLVNYPFSGAAGLFDQQISTSTGVITIPETGVYTISALAIGTQGNNIKEESAFLGLRLENAGLENGDFIISVFDIATDKTDYRSFHASFTRDLPVNADLSLIMWATASLGTFTIEETSFEIARALV